MVRRLIDDFREFPATMVLCALWVIVFGLNEKSYSAKVGADGQFLFQVPVGSYFVRGSSPLYESGGPYCLGPGFKVNENATTSVDVNCPER